MMQARRSANPLVRKLEAFTSLSEVECVALEALGASSETVPSGTDLVLEGDKPRGILLVLEGMAYRYKMRVGGARQIVAYLVPGDLGDLDAGLLDRMDHGIATFSACRVTWIEPALLTGIRRSHPKIDRTLRLGTLVDEATLREWVMNVGCRTAVERLAHLFCELFLRMDVVGLVTGNGYALPVNQAELGDTTGLSNVHVNRSLQELRRRGLIHLGGKTLTILDMPALRALAEFKPDYLHLSRHRAGLPFVSVAVP
ncbi:Crp/Fnr family transcriptional regulator [Methylobacterium flocculans]|uniref:Crp/Fnr family transcriptional regulator n=1 Tax=Methylobacterium flocculans TaxID=2984843 RepID=UPI0021F2FAA0|nr:Crp/Fnr family transcriptional regulator [Methylobacterium sp. FF17]